jgi:AraC-like DNA-binding protein
MNPIISALEVFLQNQSIRVVHFAHAGHSPPDLACLATFPRISITLKGVNRIDVEDYNTITELDVRAGEAVVTPPNCLNRPDRSSPAEVVNILMGHKQLGLSLTTYNGRETHPREAKEVVTAAFNGAELHLVQALLGIALRQNSAGAPAILTALLNSLLDTLRPQAAKSKSSAAYEAMAIYLRQNFAYPLTRESVADHFHLSAGHVSRVFRSEGLIGFNEYLNRVRIDRAKFLLRSHQLSLDEVTTKCGYADTAYFCRVFKRFTGVTPTDYRLGNEKQRQRSMSNLIDLADL